MANRLPENASINRSFEQFLHFQCPEKNSLERRQERFNKNPLDLTVAKSKLKGIKSKQ